MGLEKEVEVQAEVISRRTKNQGPVKVLMSNTEGGQEDRQKWCKKGAERTTTGDGEEMRKEPLPGQ